GFVDQRRGTEAIVRPAYDALSRGHEADDRFGAVAPTLNVRGCVTQSDDAAAHGRSYAGTDAMHDQPPRGRAEGPGIELSQVDHVYRKPAFHDPGRSPRHGRQTAPDRRCLAGWVCPCQTPR